MKTQDYHLFCYDLGLDYPAGIAWDGAYIWISDIRANLLVKIDPNSGQECFRWNTPVERPAMIGWYAGKLLQVSEVSWRLYSSTPGHGSITPLRAIREVRTPFYGMAASEDFLWILGPDTPYYPVLGNRIYKLEIKTMDVLDDFATPSYGSRGLFYWNNRLFSLDTGKNRLYVVDAHNGMILDVLRLPPGNLLQVVYDGTFFWTIDVVEKRLVRLKSLMASPYTCHRRRVYQIDFTFGYRNAGPESIKSMERCISIPRDYVNQKVIGDVKLEPEPDDYLQTWWNERPHKIARYRFQNVRPGQRRQIKQSFQIESREIRFHISPEKVEGLEKIPIAIKEKYLLTHNRTGGEYRQNKLLEQRKRFFLNETGALQKIIKEIEQRNSHPYWLARNIFDYVIQHVDYTLPYRPVTPKKILLDKIGSCGNHANVFSTLCQLAGIPTRYLIGYATWNGDSRFGVLDHEIVEIYLPGIGWLPVDTSRFMTIPNLRGCAACDFDSFGRFDDRLFFTASLGRLDCPYLQWQIFDNHDDLEGSSEILYHEYFDLHTQSLEVNLSGFST